MNRRTKRVICPPPRRVSLIYKKDDEMLADCRMMEIMDRVTQELIRRDFTVTYEDSWGVGVTILFMTKGFFIDAYRDETIMGWFRNHRLLSVVLVDDKERKFLDFVNACCSEEKHPGGILSYLSQHGVGHGFVRMSLGYGIIASHPKHRLLRPGISLAKAREFAVELAEDVADLKAFLPLYRGLKCEVVDTFEKIMSQNDEHSRDDILFALFSGCPCHCFDMSNISKLIERRKSEICPTKFHSYITLIVSKDHYRHLDDNDPFFLRDLFLDNLEPGGEFATKLSHSDYFISIQDFDISNPCALHQLANLASLLGNKSLIIVTTNASNELIDGKYVISNVRGSTCKKKTEIMFRCHAFLLSELLELNGQELPLPLSDDSSNGD